jgi:hypothetical protein
VTPRDRIALMVVLVAGLIVGSWMEIIQPKRQQAASLNTQIAAVQTQLDAVRTQVAQGELALRAFDGAYKQLAALGEAVPADDNVPSLLVQLQEAAKSAHVDFMNLAVQGGSSSSAAPVTPPSAAKAAAAPAGAAAPAATAAAAPAPVQLPPGVTVGPAGLPQEQFNFTFRGNFFHLSDFFNRLQQFVTAAQNRISISGRLMTVNAITLVPDAEGWPKIDAAVSATTYLMPPEPNPLGGATPASPATVAQAHASPSTPAISTPVAAATAPPR